MGKTVSGQPRLVFTQLKGFQAIDEQGKVKTILFLNASREVVAIIGKCIFVVIVFRLNIISFVKCIKNKDLYVKIASVESPESSSYLLFD